MIAAQQSGTAPTWQQVAKRTLPQKTLGIMGGEGWQMILSLTYAPSNPDIAYFSTDTNQIWKSINANADPHDVTWTRKGNGFFARGASSVVVHPTNPDFVLASGGRMHGTGQTIADGIYKTTDGGDNWTLVHPNYYTRDQRVSFAFAGSTIYAIQQSGGLLRSTDNGDTWNTVPKSGGGIVLNGNGVPSCIKVHPTDNNILYICTSSGLFRITMSGGTGTQQQVTTGLPAAPIILVFKPGNPKVMYVTVYNYGVYRASVSNEKTDTSFSFVARNNGLSSAIADGGKCRFIDISPANPNRLLVTLFQAPWPSKYAYYSTDEGATWTKMTTMDEKVGDGWVCGSLYHGGWTQDWAGTSDWSPVIACHPQNELIGLVVGWGEMVKKTTNGGQTWKYANSGYTGAAGAVFTKSHVAWDSLNPNRAAFAHLDFGALFTEDNEYTFRSIAPNEYSGSRGSPSIAVRGDIIVKALGSWNRDEYIVEVSRNAGISFQQVTGTAIKGQAYQWDYNFASFHPQNPNIVYIGKFKFTNIQNDNSFIDIGKPVKEMFPANGDIIYSFAGNTIYKSTNAGGTWTTPYPTLPIPSGGVLRTIAVDPTNQNRLYAAVSNSGIHIITDTVANGGEVIVRDDDNGLERDFFNKIQTGCVAVDPNDPKTIYAGCFGLGFGQSNGIFRSTDYGVIWTNINGNLGSAFDVTSIKVNPYNSYVYIGSWAGTWKLPPLTSVADTEAPKCSVNINDGALYTNSMAVTLALSATDDVGVTGYYLSTSSVAPLASAPGWTSVTPATSHTGNVSYVLSGGDGTKTVYVWYKDAVGNVSNTASDSIVYDTTAPTVTITSPTSISTYSTANSTMNMSGTASDGSSGIGVVTWSSNKGGSGTASGTSNWSASNISLSGGDNVITITATDGAGNTNTDSITVTYGYIPTVTTVAASNIANGSATLNGVANAGGLQTTCYFQYGTTSGTYTKATTLQNIAGTLNTNISANLSGLTAETQYFYRVVAENALGVVVGTELSFRTSGTATYSISINSGASYTTSRSVTLALTSHDSIGITGYCLSTSSTTPQIADPAWVTFDSVIDYSANIPYILDVGDGPITVYVWFKNSENTISSPTTSSIVLDTTAPSVSITVPTPSDTYDTTNPTVTLSGTSLDINGISKVAWSNNRGGSGMASGTISWTIANIALQADDNVITVTATDGAGNTASDVLTVTLNYAPTGSITINSGVAYTNSRSVTLNLSAADNVRVAGYFISTSSAVPLAADPGWVAVPDSPTYTGNISYTLSVGDGTKTVYAWYKDNADNVSTTYSDVIILDATVPVITITSPTSSDTYITTNSTINLAGSALDATSGLSTITWSNDRGGSGTASGTASWSITGIVLSSGDNIITVKAMDRAGNTANDAITVTYNPTTTSEPTTPPGTRRRKKKRL